MGYNHRDYSVVTLCNNNEQLHITEAYTKKAFNIETKIKVDSKMVLKINVEMLFLIYKTYSTQYEPCRYEFDWFRSKFHSNFIT